MADETLLALASEPDVGEVRTFTEFAAKLDGANLVARYDAQRAEAADGDALALPGRGGEASDGRNDPRLQFTTALFNHAAAGTGFIQPDGERVEWLECDVPVRSATGKRRRPRSGTPSGDIDLLGVADDRIVVGTVCHVPKQSTRGSTPLELLLEGLACCAAAEANREAIAATVLERTERTLSDSQPLLLVIAISRYWELYRRRATKTAGPWMAQLERLAAEVEELLGVTVRFVSIRLIGDPGWTEEDGSVRLDTDPRVSIGTRPPPEERRARARARQRLADADGGRSEIVIADPSRAPRQYSLTERYEPGDSIEHTKLGKGVVQRIVGPNKVEVLFGTEHRILVHARGVAAT